MVFGMLYLMKYIIINLKNIKDAFNMTSKMQESEDVAKFLVYTAI